MGDGSFCHDPPKSIPPQSEPIYVPILTMDDLRPAKPRAAASNLYLLYILDVGLYII
jgi:hypothetical protein